MFLTQNPGCRDDSAPFKVRHMAEMPSQPGSCFSLPPEETEAAHFACILAAAAGAGDHEELRWLLSHQPPAFEGYRQEGYLQLYSALWFRVATQPLNYYCSITMQAK